MSRRHATFAVLVLGIVAFSPPSAARAATADGEPLESTPVAAFPGGSLAVAARRDGETVWFTMTNGYAGPVTMSISFKLTNLSPDPGVATVVIPAGGTARVATFRLVDRTRPIDYDYSYSWTYGSPAAMADETVYDLPYPVGESYRVVQGYDGQLSHQDTFAVDWAMPEGSAVTAARDGFVLAFHDRAADGGLLPEYRSNFRGNWILVQHDDGTLGCYYHLKPGGVSVKAREHVAKGQVIGHSGNTGFSGSPHLHFEVRSPLDGFKYRTFPVRFRTGPDPAGENLVEQRAYKAGG